MNELDIKRFQELVTRYHKFCDEYERVESQGNDRVLDQIVRLTADTDMELLLLISKLSTEALAIEHPQLRHLECMSLMDLLHEL